MKADEPLVELETDKVTVEVPAPASGMLASISAAAGTTVNVGALLGAIEEGAAGASSQARSGSARCRPGSAQRSQNLRKRKPRSRPPCARSSPKTSSTQQAIPATGKDGRLTKGDVIEQLAKPAAKPVSMPSRRSCRHRAAKSA